MGRVIIASIVAAIILFVWGFIAWQGLHLYESAFRRAPDEPALVAALRTQLPETGAYVIPGMPEEAPDLTEEQRAALEEDWMARHRAGPIALITIRTGGGEPMEPMVFIRGFLINLLGALLICGVLAGAGAWAASYVRRLGFVLVMAIFAVLATRAVTWNWFYLPDDYAMVLAIDAVAGWLLAGLAIAAIVKPKALRG